MRKGSCFSEKKNCRSGLRGRGAASATVGLPVLTSIAVRECVM